ncbi:MAG: formyltransferase family protein [Prolixibacteraceae bacterium]|nr:formyltransferase family protein [Prolixibacteraceae bacterium]
MNKIIILLGYDYTSALQDIVNDENIFCLILENDKKYFSENNLAILEKKMGGRLYHSNIKPNDVENIVSQTEANNLLTLGWRKLIDVNKFHGMDYLINVHPALLPEYKGYHPVPYVILNEEKRHGVTAHLITPEMDAGEIVLKESFNINPFSTIKSLQDEVMNLMPSFLNKLVNQIKKNEISLSPNIDEKTIIKAPKRKPEDSKIELKDTLYEVFKKFKASDPNRFPAYFEYMGEKIYISMRRDESAERKNKFDI